MYKPAEYNWQGDWEGRALLAFCCLYEITGKKNPDMDDFIEVYPTKTNQDGYLGKLFSFDQVDEQQLSGHNWLLSGMVEYYKLFKSQTALKHAKNIFNNLYYKGLSAMTYTYENFNWFERKDTWTEPCAVIDSFMLAINFYKETNYKKYLTLLRRVWFNGLNHCHRNNGGVGTSKTVYADNAYTAMNLFEAPFCCTMRYCEGLAHANANRELLKINENAEIITDELGRRFKDDALIITDEEAGKEFAIYTLAFQEKSDKKYRVF